MLGFRDWRCVVDPIGIIALFVAVWALRLNKKALDLNTRVNWHLMKKNDHDYSGDEEYPRIS